MRRTRFFPLLALIGTLVPAASAWSQAVTPSVQILHPVDETRLITLQGNTHPLANARTDRGPVSPDLPMTGLILVLSRSPQQQAAFEKFIASQYDPASPNFHHWLTPVEVGQDFGPSQTDVATVSNWLAAHGFSIAALPPSRMSIRFSGTAAQVESAFHTEIHTLEVKGIRHIGNMSDPQIPEALAPAVAGVKSLHNFFPRPMHRTGSKVTRDTATGKWRRIASTGADSTPRALARPASHKPQFGITDSNGDLVEDVVPYDFATIYNVAPLWNAASPIDGTGQTIAIAGTSDITLADVTTFRSSFGLPAYTSANQPTIISGNSQPLTNCNTDPYTTICTQDDTIENSLDVEWSGAIAKGANIVLVASYPASDSDDNLYDSESYIVNNQTASIMSVSYGECELGIGTAGNTEYNSLWQTAAAEGIAVFVASGDGGSPECDDGGDANGNPYSAQYGLAVNGLASTPYNTAVGGTDFSWCAYGSSTCTAGTYWNSTTATNGSSAIGYVPETPWNDTCANPLTLSALQADASTAGDPSFTTPEGACNFVYNDSLQSDGGLGLSGLIDTVGGAGGVSNCTTNNTPSTGTSIGTVASCTGGYAKPSWQTGVSGIPSDSKRDIPDVSFFASDGYISSSSYLICVSALDSNNECVYTNDSDLSAQEVGGTSVATPAMAGVMALINQKAGEAQGSPNTELYTLGAAQTYSSCSAENVTTSSSCYFNDIDTGTNAMPCDYGALEGTDLTTGIQSPGCTPATAGDLIGILTGYGATVGYDQATGLGSLNVANVVDAWPASTATAKTTVTVTPTPTSLAATSTVSVAITVAAATSGGATPTGKVTLIGGGAYSSGAQDLSSGAATISIPANTLPAGSDVFTVSYSGDTTYAAATGTATVTVTATTTSSTGTFTLAATTPTAVSAGTSSSSTITVSATGGYAGTASLTCAVTTSPTSAVDAPTCTLSPTSVTLSSTSTSGTVTATIATTAATTSQLVRPGSNPRGDGSNPSTSKWMGGSAVLALLVFFGIPARRRSWRSMLGALVLVAALGSLSGCGDFWQAPAGNTADGTTSGTYTFTVTGTGDPTVTAVTTTFTLTVN
jgi:subtilase family serine protease